MGGFRGFGRSPTLTDSPPPIAGTAEKAKQLGSGQASPAKSAEKALQVEPPIRRFLDVQSPSDLKVGDLGELLKDYKRLAGALKDLGAV